MYNLDNEREVNTMWEFEVKDKRTGEMDIFFGYNFKDACERAHECSVNWENLGSWYID